MSMNFMKKHFLLLSKFSALAVLTISALPLCIATGCGSDDKPAESVLNTTETTVTEESEEQGNIIMQSGKQDDNVQIKIQDFNKTFNRHNEYTGEIEYTYQIDELRASWEKSSFGYDIKLLYTGKKTYDSKGADAARPVKSVVRIIDEDGYIIDSCTTYSQEALCEGDSFEQVEFDGDLRNVSLDDGVYTLELLSEDADTVSLAVNDEIRPNPKRYYCPYAIPSIHETDAELPFDIDEKWIDMIALKDVHITEDGILSGFFEENFDLSKAEYAGESDNFDSFIKDAFFRSTKRYDINNPEDYLTGVPEEAMPDSIRISYSPDGDIAVGERRCVYVSFCYKHTKEDEYSYVALMFQYFPGNALTEDEWCAVKENAEEIGEEVPQ